jgi:hypothetical protein
MKLYKRKSESEQDRMEILRYLNECGLQIVTPQSILVFLDDTLNPVSRDGIEFHLRYMRDRRWVELGCSKFVGEPEKVQWVRITADGVDEFDRRAKLLGEVR